VALDDALKELARNDERKVKGLDFGIAKLLDPAAARTATCLLALTQQYASPEQVEGAAIATTSDAYSLGVVLYELLSGGGGAVLDHGHARQ
jgi:eukaryotic-like serine/threonine-protein kinase